MAERSRINKSFLAILARVGYKENGSHNMDTQPKEVAEKLGKAVFDYLTASIYDTDWEGFTEEDLEGIDAFMYDLALSVEAS